MLIHLVSLELKSYMDPLPSHLRISSTDSAEDSSCLFVPFPNSHSVKGSSLSSAPFVRWQYRGRLFEAVLLKDWAHSIPSQKRLQPKASNFRAHLLKQCLRPKIIPPTAFKESCRCVSARNGLDLAPVRKQKFLLMSTLSLLRPELSTFLRETFLQLG